MRLKELCVKAINYLNTKAVYFVPFALFALSCIISYYNYNGFKNIVIVGGDIEPYTYFPDHFLNYDRFTSIWSDNLLYGGPINDMARYVHLPIYYFSIFFKNLFNSPEISQIIIYLVYNFSIIISWYLLFNSFVRNRWASGFFSIAVFVHPLTWLLWYRHIDFYNLLLISTPLLFLAIKNLLFNPTYKKWLLYLLALILVWFAAVLPTYTGIQLLAAFIFILVLHRYYGLLDKKTVIFKTMVILLLLLPLLPLVYIYYTFTHSGVVVLQDYWSKSILLEGVLSGNKIMNGLGRVFAGLNQETYTVDGWLGGKPFALYGGFNIINSLPYIALSLFYLPFWIHTLIVKRSRIIVISSICFLLVAFISKSTAEPFGSVYEYLVSHFSFLSGFRAVYQKTAPIFLLAFVFLLISIYHSLADSLKKIFISLIVVLTFFNSISYFQGTAIPQTLKNNPNVFNNYVNASSFLNHSDAKKIVLLPFIDKTWVELKNGYEGYHPMEYFLKDKEFYNIGYASNAPGVAKVAELLQKFEEDPNLSIEKLSKVFIDTIVYDTNVDRAERRHIQEKHGELLALLRTNNKLKEIWSGEGVFIFHIEGVQTNMFEADKGHIEVNKIRQNMYTLQIQPEQKDIHILFKQTYSSLWQLRETDCKNQQILGTYQSKVNTVEGIDFNSWDLNLTQDRLACFTLSFPY